MVLLFYAVSSSKNRCISTVADFWNYQLHGLWILSTEEQSQKDIAATIGANGKYNPEEVTFKTGDYEWKGVGFNALGSDVAQMFAMIGDNVINLRMAGFAYNSDD
ncbi:MAG: hypothetical protein IJ823_00985, partial [Bacteroidales bacterium]|nr:hypothetical protein [Bacteroidales bacterium]